jgi:hypothetical protein
MVPQLLVVADFSKRATSRSGQVVKLAKLSFPPFAFFQAA